jgi:hypothetical protein
MLRSLRLCAGTLPRFGFSSPAFLPAGRQAFIQHNKRPLLPGRWQQGKKMISNLIFNNYEKHRIINYYMIINSVM